MNFPWTEYGYADIDEYAIKNNALSNGVVESRYYDIFAFLLGSYFGHIKIVQYIITLNTVDIHYDDDLALCLACQGGFDKIASLLIDKGANIHARKGICLRLALTHSFPVIVSLLSNNGAKLHVGDDHFLCQAARMGLVDIVLLLLDHGADVNAQIGKPLWLASYYNHKPVAFAGVSNGNWGKYAPWI